MDQGHAFPLKVVKRLLEAGIVFYAFLLLFIILTGGFKITVLGMSVKGTSVLTPLRFLLPLLFLRFLITVQIKDLLLIMLSVVTCLAGLEIFIRIWNPPIAAPSMKQIHRASSTFGWELIPGSYGIGGLGEKLQINSLGFRDRELPIKKLEKMSRIMVIGDSFTFGMGVHLDDTYPKQIERILQRTNIRCEVINCGVIGYNMWQHLEVLNRKVLPLDPDLVILGLFFDDLHATVPPYNNIENWEGSNPFEARGSSRVAGKFALLNVLKNASALFEYRYRSKRGDLHIKGMQERKKILGPRNPDDRNYKLMSGKAGRQVYESFLASLGEFVAACRRAGVPVLVVMIPDSVQLNDAHMQAVNRIIEAYCEEIGVPYLDVTVVLQAENNPESLYLFPLDAHNGPKGLELIANSISEKIVRLGFLSTDPEPISKFRESINMDVSHE